MRVGKQTWEFASMPAVLGRSTAVGPREGRGPLGQSFDLVYEDPYAAQSSWEKAELAFMEKAQEKAVEKAGLTMESIDMVVSGDLLAQNICSNFAGRTAGRPLFGVFSACATSMQAVATAALLIESGAANYTVAAASSHHSSAERMFRFPTEYGGQKPPTAHCTVTGAGAIVLGNGTSRVRVRRATLGKVVDLGVQSPWEMGAAMAPAAVDTIAQHFEDTGLSPADYDLVATGDLARVGLPIAKDMLAQRGIDMGDTFTDCGILMFDPAQPDVFSGGSGPACCACVTFGHLLGKVERGELRRILVIATGALLSPLSAQQKETIPCIAHAVSFECSTVE